MSRVSVTFLDEALTHAALRIEPSWWRRWLLGEKESEQLLVAVADLAGGRLWIYDSTGKRVRDRVVLEELERQHIRASAALRVHALLTRAT